MVAWNEYKKHAQERGSLAMELFVVVTTPVVEPDKVKDCLPDHLAYQAELEAANLLAFAGPLSDLSGDNMQGSGMIVYKAQSLEQARSLAENDPMHSRGIREFTLRRWLVNEGSLQLDIKLSAQSVRLTVD